MRKVHEVNLQKQKGQLITVYRNAGWMSPELMNVIHRVINDCKVCQKFSKSVVRLRVTLPKSTSFNKVDGPQRIWVKICSVDDRFVHEVHARKDAI